MPAGAAENPPGERADVATFRLALRNTEPWLFHDRDCRWTGVVPDFLAEVEMRSGWRFELVTQRSDDFDSLAGRKDIDLFVGYPQAQRPPGTRESPLFEIGETSLAVFAPGTTDLDSLAGLTLATATGPVRAVLAEKYRLQLVSFPYQRDAVRAWLADEADGVLGQTVTVRFNCLLLRCDSKALFTPIEVVRAPVWLYRLPRPEGPHWISDDELVAAMRPLIDQGLVDLLWQKYLTLESVDRYRSPRECEAPERRVQPPA